MTTDTLSATPPVFHRLAGNRPPLISVRAVNFWYGAKPALMDVDLDIHPGEVIAFMGPSGCGKTTLLKLLNRMHDDTPGARMTGSITLDGADIYAPEIDPPVLRKRFGWVAQKPNPFADSVRENIAYGARLHGLYEGRDLDAHVERCLTRAALWDEVRDRLGESGLDLSGGQQQRLCIARALSTEPDAMLMDEPCSSIDPIATAGIEALIRELARSLAIVIITHNMEQARRIADRVAFFKLGRLLEVGPAREVFDNPQHPETRAYLAGAFG
ncbi:MAG: phosphate ABC transporter ATP-binding protein [Pseudomonadota bacterium]